MRRDGRRLACRALERWHIGRLCCRCVRHDVVLGEFEWLMAHLQLVRHHGGTRILGFPDRRIPCGSLIQVMRTGAAPAGRAGSCVQGLFSRHGLDVQRHAEWGATAMAKETRGGCLCGIRLLCSERRPSFNCRLPLQSMQKNVWPLCCGNPGWNELTFKLFKNP